MRFAVLLFLFFSHQAVAKKIRYPTVLQVQGQVRQIETKTEKNIRRGMSLKDKVVIRSQAKSELRLALNEKATLILGPETEVELPEITWNDGGVSEIILRKGQIRYICQSECERKLVTVIFESVLPVGDYLLSYDPLLARVELAVIAGEAPFRGLENENSVVLHAGERASFQGLLENQEPAFDTLLKGRKVARGQLSEVQKIPEAEIKKLKNSEADRLKALKAPPKKKRKSSQICAKPFGEFQQCAWVCEGKNKSKKECQVDKGATCVRMRCNANGEWADRMELTASQNKCLAKPLVGMCDY